MATLKGQNFRILTYDAVASKFKCVGMASSCTVNLTANTDDASTKDDIGGAQKPTVTNKSWQVSVESLSVADITAILTAIRSSPFCGMRSAPSITNCRCKQVSLVPAQLI